MGSYPANLTERLKTWVEPRGGRPIYCYMADLCIPKKSSIAQQVLLKIRAEKNHICYIFNPSILAIYTHSTRTPVQLTKYTDYAFRTLIFLGVQPPAELITITKVSEHFDMPRNHLIKVVHNLGKLGYLETVRGKGGGIRLARPASKISLREIVEAMEEKLEPVNCHKPSCRIVTVCQLRSVLAEAQEAFLAVLGNYTLADIQQRPDQLQKLLKLYPVSS